MKSAIKIGVASATATAAVFALSACGNSPSDPTPNQGSPASSAPATSTDLPSNPNPNTLEMDPPTTKGSTVGLNLSISGNQQSAIGEGQITVSGGSLSIGIGGPSSIVGDKVLLTNTTNGTTRVLNQGQQEMKATDGASYAMFTLNGVSRTETYQIMTITKANMPDLSTSRVLPSTTPISGYSAKFRVNYQQN